MRKVFSLSMTIMLIDPSRVQKRKVKSFISTPLSPLSYSPSTLRATPSSMGKINPKNVLESEFFSLITSAPTDKPADKWIVGTFMGVAPVVAREIVLKATGRTDTLVCDCDKNLLWASFSQIADVIKSERFTPTLALDGEKCVEYSFIELTQYASLEIKAFESAGKLLDAYFASRDNDIRVHQRASDILKLLSNAESRILKKIDIQRSELEACDEGESYKKYGDLITANIYRLQKRVSVVELEDYETMDEDGNFSTLKIALDTRLSPAANAQRYYKKYAKTKTARVELAKQISLAEEELEYIYTVFDALTRAESPADLAEIRDELYRAGYASRMKAYSGGSHKQKAPAIMQFETLDGMRVLCGKNNLQNEHITHKLAEKHDYWFHAKGTAGSHVLLVTEGKEPTDLDFTTAAEIAAYYSKSEGSNIGVDYTLAKNVKKAAGGRPGFVIYHTNWTAYVTPNGEKISALRKK